MKKNLIIAMAVLATLVSCNGGGSFVSLADTYETDAYMSGRLDVFNQCPLAYNDIVMLGDDWIDQGEWHDFYDNNKIKNRGILRDKAAWLPARLDSIVAKKPAKVFVSAGLNDICEGAAAKEVADNLNNVFSRIARVTPKTECYYINAVALPALTDAQKAEVAALNEMMEKAAGKGGFTYIDLNSALEGGIADSTYSWNGGRYLNGAGFEAYAKLLAEHIGSDALNKAADKESDAVDAYLQGWYGVCDPATCYPSDYYLHRVSVFRSLPVKGNGVIMLGDSLTDYAEWNDLFNSFNFPILNRGIAGDMIEGVELRLDEVAAQKPNKIFLLVGCNNLLKYPEGDDVAVFQKLVDLVKKVHEACPKATVYVQSLLPLNPMDPAFKTVNPATEKINKALKEAAKAADYYFIDITSPLKDENGDLRLECTTDGCHLNATGYFTWATELLQMSRLLVIGNPYEQEIK